MKSKQFIKKYKSLILNSFFAFLLGGVLLIFLIPSISFSLGNTFFGDVKVLYNLRLAQFFFLNSTHPILPLAVPHYAHHQLSRTYFIEGKLDGALSEAKKELKLYPEDTSTYYILGLTYGYLNREKEAIDAFSAYIDKNPLTWAARNDKAWLQFRVGNIDDAIRTLEPVAMTQTTNVWVQNSYCAFMIAKRAYDIAEISCNLAKAAINQTNEDSWGKAYPGNDPRIYNTGLAATRKSIEENLSLIEKNKKI